MKIKKITKIEKYKSFNIFEPKNLEFHNKLNLFFGENGNGKSSIVDIFKNLSGNKEFEKTPNAVILTINQNEYKFENKVWNQVINKNQFVFFDDDFIAKNIHVNKDRDNTKTGPAQHSSKVLISIDENAIELKSLQENKKKEQKDKNEEIKKFEKENKQILSEDFTRFKISYEDFKKKGELEKLKETNNSKIIKIKESKKMLESNLKNLEKIQELELNKEDYKKEEINLERFNQNINSITGLNIKENTISNVQQELINYLRDNKDFFEKGFELRKSEKTKKCPFCLSENKETEIDEIFKLKEQIFDDSYKKHIDSFNKLKKEILDYLNILKNKNFSFNDLFDKLEKINSEFQISDFYSIKEKDDFKEFKFKYLEDLISQLNNISEKNNINYSLDSLSDFRKEVESLNMTLIKFNSINETKNIILSKFKEENSNNKITTNLEIIDKDIKNLEFSKEFYDKFFQIKLYFEKSNILEEKEIELVNIGTELKRCKDDYRNYCTKNIFEKKAKTMTKYLDRFNLNFEIKVENKVGVHEIIPFTFKVIDKNTGEERTLKEGFSNGELQILSISFFLTCLDSYGEELKNKVIFFDDPISSLDNSNLNILIDILKEKITDLNQVFIYTHHLTFFKFLSKKFGNDIKPNEFVVLKNKYDLGGSFYCRFGKDNFLDSLKKFKKENIEETKKYNSYSYEKNVLKYGQYLRYEVENFIKNDLLAWNKSNNFSSIVDNLKIKSLTDKDIEEIKKIYQFCNWTTSHVDIHENCFLNRLKENIDNFIKIKEENKS